MTVVSVDVVFVLRLVGAPDAAEHHPLLKGLAAGPLSLMVREVQRVSGRAFLRTPSTFIDALVHLM